MKAPIASRLRPSESPFLKRRRSKNGRYHISMWVGTVRRCLYSRLPKSALPVRNKVADIARELLRVLTVVEVASVVDDEHTRPLIVLRDHIEQRQPKGQDRRRIILTPIKQGRGL